MGRRSGKTRCMAVFGAWIAACHDWRNLLAPGEHGQVLVVSQSRDQASNFFGMICGAFEAAPALRSLVANKTSDTLTLRSRAQIVVRPSSFRSTRGQTAIAVLCDEIAYWRNEDSLNPDVEILRALRPSLASTQGKLVCISSPYSRHGELWRHYQRHFGKPGGSILVAQ